MTSPARQKKHDKLIFGPASAEEIARSMAAGPLDAVVREMDRKWGVDRLPDLVSPETAAKWGSALGKLNAAIESGTIEDTTARVHVCIRGMRAMDAEAAAAGHTPSNPDVWEIEIDGRRIGLLRDGCEWPAAGAQWPELKIYTLREAVIALLAYKAAGPLVDAVKANFPGAEINAIRNSDLEDEIPW